MAYQSVIELARLAWLLPSFVSKVTQLQANFEKRTGERTVVVSGHRGDDVQAKVYADSIKAGAYKGAQGYRAAPPGRSKHKYAAADLNIIGHTHGDAAKDQREPLYGILAEEARKLGLKAGYDFKPGGLPDPYHVEDPRTLVELATEYAAFLRGRLWRAAITIAVVAVIAAVGYKILNRGRTNNVNA